MDNKSSGGIGFVEVLTIVFIVLKLIGVIDWSWLWVLSPIWIDLLIILFFYSNICFKGNYGIRTKG